MTILSIKRKIEKLTRIRAEALRQKRELHQRRFDPYFTKDFETYGKVIDSANAAIFELEQDLEIKLITA